MKLNNVLKRNLKAYQIKGVLFIFAKLFEVAQKSAFGNASGKFVSLLSEILCGNALEANKMDFALLKVAFDLSATQKDPKFFEYMNLALDAI